jgi:iron complex transport system permease protein
VSVVRWALLVALLGITVLLALGIGSVPIAPGEVWHALLGGGDATAVSIVRDLRLPRIALGLAVGAGLAASGTALQATLRNPLAEPYLLGVSGGAAVGAVLTVVLGVTSLALLPLAAFIGATMAVLLVLLVARAAGGRADPRVLVMAGVVVGAFANAAIMVALTRAPENTVRGALWWMMGSLGEAQWGGVRWIALYVAAGIALLIAWAREIDVLALGEEAAASLGLEVERATRRVYLIAGLIGFVGLVVPSIARALGARTTRVTVAASALVGATLVVAADAVARVALRPSELPLGAVTALIGVPFFLWRLKGLR